MFDTILVPLDGSRRAEAALPAALDLCRHYSAELLLFQVRPQPHPAAYYAEAQHLDELYRALEQASHDYLQARVKELGPCDVKVSTEHVEGHPAEAILERASRLRRGLIVMASHGREGLKRWALGSTAERVARHSKCPVMLLKEPE